jgi:uncharacterized membrane protein
METYSDVEPIPSKASIGGHPIHPMLIPFPVALLALVPLTDIVFAAGQGTFWAVASYYLIWAGVLTGGLAAAVGLIDFVGIRRVRQRRAGWIHLGSNVMVLGLAVVNGLIRIDDVAAPIAPAGIMLSVITATLLIVSGWYGGELAYRHNIGIKPKAEVEGQQVATHPAPGRLTPRPSR